MDEKISDTIDPVTGVRKVQGFKDDLLVIHEYQDLEPIVERTKALRNADEYSANGIKNNMWHVGHIPDIICGQLAKHGIDVMKAPIKDILAKVRELGLEHFITTKKNV